MNEQVYSKLQTLYHSRDALLSRLLYTIQFLISEQLNPVRFAWSSIFSEYMQCIMDMRQSYIIKLLDLLLDLMNAFGPNYCKFTVIHTVTSWCASTEIVGRLDVHQVGT